MLDGWISSGEYGSSCTRPDSTWALMSRSESSTVATYRLSRYDAGSGQQAAVAVRRRAGRRRLRGCSSMAEHQLPKLTVRVRFPSPALI